MQKIKKKDLAARLRQLRLIHGFTQQNIADILVVNRSTYTYYETGKTRPPIETLRRLALLYDMDIENILYGIIAQNPQNRQPEKGIQEKPRYINELSSEEKCLIAQLRVLEIKDITFFIQKLQQALLNFE